MINYVIKQLEKAGDFDPQDFYSIRVGDYDSTTLQGDYSEALLEKITDYGYEFVDEDPGFKWFKKGGVRIILTT